MCNDDETNNNIENDDDFHNSGTGSELEMKLWHHGAPLFEFRSSKHQLCDFL